MVFRRKPRIRSLRDLAMNLKETLWSVRLACPEGRDVGITFEFLDHARPILLGKRWPNGAAEYLLYRRCEPDHTDAYFTYERKFRVGGNRASRNLKTLRGLRLPSYPSHSGERTFHWIKEGLERDIEQGEVGKNEPWYVDSHDLMLERHWRMAEGLLLYWAGWLPRGIHSELDNPHTSG